MTKIASVRGRELFIDLRLEQISGCLAPNEHFGASVILGKEPESGSESRLSLHILVSLK